MNLNQVAISTAGDGMHGVFTGASSQTNYNGGSVTTSGAGAYGLYVTGVDGYLSASDVSISTSGAGAYGAAADNSGALSLGDGMKISTTGADAHGLYVAGVGAGAELTGSASINVSGANAAGIYVDAGGAVGAKGPLTINAASYGLLSQRLHFGRHRADGGRARRSADAEDYRSHRLGADARRQ